MPQKNLETALSFWAPSLAVAIVTLFTLAANSNAQETLRPYASPILHTFLDSANVYPESVTVDQSSGAFFVGSVKGGTIYIGKVSRPSLEVFSPGPGCLTNMDMLLLNGRGVMKFQLCYLKKYIEIHFSHKKAQRT